MEGRKGKCDLTQKILFYNAIARQIKEEKFRGSLAQTLLKNAAISNNVNYRVNKQPTGKSNANQSVFANV